MEDKTSSNNKDTAISSRLHSQPQQPQQPRQPSPPQQQQQQQQQRYTKDTAHRLPSKGLNRNYRSTYQQQQQQQRYERTQSSAPQQPQNYNDGQYRPRNPPPSSQRPQQQQQISYQPPSQGQWRPRSIQQNNNVTKPQSASPSNVKGSDTDEGDLVKSMQALSTNDIPTKTVSTQDGMADDNNVLECIATPLILDDLRDIIGKYESMRGGCRIQKIDDTKALVVFGHSSTAKRAWTENKSNDKIKIQGYQGPRNIIEDVPIVRKSALTQQPRPTNMVAKRLIHGSLGLKAPAKAGTHQKTAQDTQDRRNQSTPKR